MKQGTVLISDFVSIRNKDISPYPIRLHITLSIKQGIHVSEGFVHVPQLAPSSKLFNKVKRWKNCQFTDEEWFFLERGKERTWYDLYSCAFISDSKIRKDFQSAYKRLKQRLDEGNNIVIVCYCQNEKKCHRKIVGKMLESENYKVIYE